MKWHKYLYPFLTEMAVIGFDKLLIVGHDSCWEDKRYLGRTAVGVNKIFGPKDKWIPVHAVC